jgi:peptide deformylase
MKIELINLKLLLDPLAWIYERASQVEKLFEFEVSNLSSRVRKKMFAASSVAIAATQIAVPIVVLAAATRVATAAE